jgi:YD repeat-containing protein
MFAVNICIRNSIEPEKISEPTNGNRTTDFVYDKVGNRLGQTEIVGNTTKTTAYIYDANDRLLSETSDGQLTSYTYDNKGNTLSKQDSNGTTAYTWNDEGRLIQAVTKDSGGSTLHQMEYRYNSSGIRVVSSADGQQAFNLIDRGSSVKRDKKEF